MPKIEPINDQEEILKEAYANVPQYEPRIEIKPKDDRDNGPLNTSNSKVEPFISTAPRIPVLPEIKIPHTGLKKRTIVTPNAMHNHLQTLIMSLFVYAYGFIALFTFMQMPLFTFLYVVSAILMIKRKQTHRLSAIYFQTLLMIAGLSVLIGYINTESLSVFSRIDLDTILSYVLKNMFQYGSVLFSIVIPFVGIIYLLLSKDVKDSK